MKIFQKWLEGWVWNQTHISKLRVGYTMEVERQK